MRLRAALVALLLTAPVAADDVLGGDIWAAILASREAAKVTAARQREAEQRAGRRQLDQRQNCPDASRPLTEAPRLR